MSDKIPLPIELYPSIKSNLFSVIFGGGVFWLGHIVNDIANEIFIVIIAVLCMVIGVIFIFMGLFFLINPAPTLTISRYRIIHGHEFFRKLFNKHLDIAFKDIHTMTLDFYVQKDIKYWYIHMTLKNGKTAKLPLFKLKYERVMINEREIFHLIEQIHQGQIPPTFVDFDMDIHDRITKWGIFMIIAVVALLIYGNLIR
ncbi:hypothetical protein [Moraxella oblonga]|uniref:hypothetical protein n=1 Tax=Moraxella oblonga TaxID=200413 RepID=UPI00083460EE|nr:hypothetical protein [Moraxella oblonga]